MTMMMPMGEESPARRVLTQASEFNRAAGHENLGFLSEEWGFLPAEAPLLGLPESHRAWDELCARLPELYRQQAVREAIEALPALDFSRQALPDRYLCRAASAAAILAHAYVRSRPEAAPVPASVEGPWREVTRRLGRPAPVLSYIDLIVYNWRLRDPRGPRRLENLELLLPTVNNQEERIFYLTQVEMLAEASPLVASAVRAQEAVMRRDAGALRREMIGWIERLRYLTDVCFQKIDMNPRSATHVDPVVWAKTVAPFAVPLEGGPIGADGTAAPIFHLLDALTGRASRESRVASTARAVRRSSPPHWEAFVEAAEAFPIRPFVQESGDRCLQGVFAEVVDAYAGDKGLLGAHRLKAYGFIEIAFKVGRSVTIGGFEGMFKDRTWEETDRELEVARVERLAGLPPACAAGAASLAPGAGGEGVARVSLGVEGQGLRYAPGDRCGVLAESEGELVDRTLQALRARGGERIKLDRAWQAALALRPGYAGTRELPVRALLTFGKIRPISREVAKALLAVSASEPLRGILQARAEDQWELWDLLELLARGGFDARRLWKAEPWEPESLCKIVPPGEHRLYSIASAMAPAEGGFASSIELLVSPLSYRTEEGPHSRAGERRGTASCFLARAAAQGPAAEPVGLRVVPAPRFRLPTDPSRPVIMFAGGAGVSPFLGFMAERSRGGGDSWLFFGARGRSQIHGRRELSRWVAEGKLRLTLALSGEDAEARCLPGEGLVLVPGVRRRIGAAMEAEAEALWRAMLPREGGGGGGYFYVCGRAGFAASVLAGLKAVAGRFAPAGDEASREAFACERLYRLAAEGRLLQDVFTTYEGPAEADKRLFDASEIAAHNSAQRGYWLVISGKVYDMTEFAQLHPGGDRLVYEHAGTDATRAYRAVQHHVNPEVDALLAVYALGKVRRLDFGARWGVAFGDAGLAHVSLSQAFREFVRFLYTVTSMQNALVDDFSVVRRPTTAGARPSELDPYRVSLVIEAHRRFVGSYLDGVAGPAVDRLFRLAVGLFAPALDVRRMRSSLEAVERGDDARLARGVADRMRSIAGSLAARPDPYLEGSLRRLCAVVEAQDLRFLAECKGALREAVAAFERHESRAIELGGAQIIEALLRLPAVVERHHGALAAAMRVLGLDAPP